MIETAVWAGKKSAKSARWLSEFNRILRASTEAEYRPGNLVNGPPARSGLPDG